MYALILITLALNSQYGQSGGTTTLKLNSNMTLEQCKTTAAAPLRDINVGENRHVIVFTICVKES